MNASMILNPNAGQGDAADRLRRFASESDIELCETQEKGDATRAARAVVAAGRELLIVVGGDGTLNEAVNGMAPAFDAVRLLIVPAGTANDFARTLRLPNDLDAALALIDTGSEVRIDLIEMTDEQGTHYVLNAATGGFSEQVHEYLDSDMKERWGALAYLRAAAQAARDPRMYHATLRVDGQPMEAAAYSVVVANGRFAGGGVPLAPNAGPEDHLLDLLAITSTDLWSRLGAASRFIFGSESETAGALIQRGREIHLETVPQMAFSSDGEPVGRTPVDFRILPGALRILVEARE